MNLISSFSLFPNPLPIIQHLVDKSVAKLDENIQSTYLHNALKIFVKWLHHITQNLEFSEEEYKESFCILETGFSIFISSEIEVQERACSYLEIIKKLNIDPMNNSMLFVSMFDASLVPVSIYSQETLEDPCLNLDEWINEPLSPVKHDFDDGLNIPIEKLDFELPVEIDMNVSKNRFTVIKDDVNHVKIESLDPVSPAKEEFNEIKDPIIKYKKKRKNKKRDNLIDMNEIDTTQFITAIVIGNVKVIYSFDAKLENEEIKMMVSILFVNLSDNKINECDVSFKCNSKVVNLISTPSKIDSVEAGFCFPIVLNLESKIGVIDHYEIDCIFEQSSFELVVSSSINMKRNISLINIKDLNEMIASCYLNITSNTTFTIKENSDIDIILERVLRIKRVECSTELSLRRYYGNSIGDHILIASVRLKRSHNGFEVYSIEFKSNIRDLVEALCEAAQTIK